MKYIKSSRQSIIVGFSLILILLVGMGVLGINYMNSMQNQLDNIVRIHNFRSESFNILRNIARERSLILYQMNLKRDVFFTDEAKERMSNLAGEFIGIREKLREVESGKSAELTLEKILPEVTYSTSIQSEIIKLLEQERYEEANTLLTEKSIPVQDELLAKYDQLALKEQKEAHKAANEAARQYKLSLYSMSILGALLLGLGSFISIFVIRRVTHAETVMQDVNAKLEERVEQRTYKLSQANNALEETLDQLQSTQGQLVQSEKMAALGSLVAGISHEINTPVGIAMTAITHQQEQSSELEKSYQLGNMKRSDLEKFVSNIQQSNNLIINNLLRASEMVASFKRVAVDQSNEHWELINLKEYLDSTILSLHPKIKQREIDIENRCADDLTLFTNPGAVYQVMSNLILNSLFHAFQDNETGCVSIDAEKHGDHIVIDFKDNGRGMTEEEQSKAFDPFFTTKRGQGGSGLGLHLVYNLVTSGLDGTILLASSEGQGCHFHIELPINKEKAAKKFKN